MINENIIHSFLSFLWTNNLMITSTESPVTIINTLNSNLVMSFVSVLILLLEEVGKRGDD